MGLHNEIKQIRHYFCPYRLAGVAEERLHVGG